MNLHGYDVSQVPSERHNNKNLQGVSALHLVGG